MLHISEGQAVLSGCEYSLIYYYRLIIQPFLVRRESARTHLSTSGSRMDLFPPMLNYSQPREMECFHVTNRGHK